MQDTNDNGTPGAGASRVSGAGMAAIVAVTLVSLGLSVLWVVLLVSDHVTGHGLSGTGLGMAAAYGAVFVTAAVSIALLFRLLVGQAGSH